MENSNQPINPITEEETDRIDAGIKIYSGLTKREYYAGLAMQALIANAPSGNLSNSKEGCALAAQWADDLLLELEK